MSTEKEKLVGFTIALMEEIGPVEFLEFVDREAWLKYPISGVRQAANDMIEATKDISGDKLRELDAVLTEQGFPALSQMREKGYKKVIQVLSRNSVRNEDEWRLLRAFSEPGVLNEVESDQLQTLMDEYEFKRT